MNWKNWMAAVVAAIALGACGGGGGDNPAFGSGQSDGGGTGGGDSDGGSSVTSASAIDVSTSSLELGSASSESVTITALVKSEGSVIMANQAVTLSTSSGALVVSSATTDAAGMVTATLKAGTGAAADKANRTITVTATSGTATGAVTVNVVGTSASVAGPTSFSAGGTAGTLTVSVTDSLGVAVAGATVTASSSQIGNALTAASSVTGSDGSIAFIYTPTNAGSDTIVFSVLGATVSTSVVVNGQDFVFFSPAASSSVTVGDAATVSVRYRISGVPQAGRNVVFASTAGTFSTPTTAMTNGSGEASATLSSTFAGAATVTASISGAGTATLPLSFVAVTPANIVVQATPTAIGRNLSGSVAQQATIVARVTDINGNPVASQTVNFSRQTDLSGGNLSAPSALTNSNGEASVQYIAGAQATAVNGVLVSATVQDTVISGTTALTVNQGELFIGLGTSNTISNLTLSGGTVDETMYSKPWTVYVTDASGAAMSGVRVTISVLPVQYGKGSLTWIDPIYYYTQEYAGVPSTVQSIPAGEVLWCDNEDLDYDGVLDAGEDVDGSGQLDPGNVISLAPGNSVVTTDANGRATINLQYAESYAPWVRVTIRATAVVSGTEARRDVTFVANGLSTDFDQQAVSPAGRFSPFGQRASCSSPD